MGLVRDFREIIRFRGLLFELVLRDLKVRYKRSAIGFLWSMLNPLLMMLVMSMVFENLFKSAVPDYPIYVFCGLLFWNFFSASTTTGLQSILGNGNLIKKVYVPVALYPLSNVASALVNSLLSLGPLFILMALFHAHFHMSLLLLPISIAIVVTFSTGITLLLATVNVFFRDVTHLYTVALTALVYLTPVMYPASIIPKHYSLIYKCNPLYYYLTLLRDPIYNGTFPSLITFALSGLLAILTLILGYAYLFAHRNKFIQSL